MISFCKSYVRSPIYFFIAFSIVFFSHFSASSAAAQNGSWNVDAAGTFSTASNWAGSVVPGAGGVATFGDSFGLSASRTVTIAALGPALSGITFDTNFAYTLSTNPVNLDLNGFNLNVLRANGNTVSLFATGHTISSVIAGTSTGFIKNGSGVVTLSGTNTFTAPITINSGVLRFTNGDAALGNVANSLTINGGTLRTSTTALTTARSVTIGANGAIFDNFVATPALPAAPTPNTFNGTLSGTGLLNTRVGNSGFTLAGSGAGFTGAVRTESNTFTLTNNGVLGGTAGMDIAGTLALTNTTTNIADRINDGRAITLRGSQISFTGNAAGTTEVLGNLQLNGASTITNTSDTVGSTLRFSGLTRNNRSTVLFRGTDLGGTTPPTSQIEFSSSPGALIGGGGALTTTTKNISILAFAHGSNSATATLGTNFVSFDNATNRMFVLGASNYNTLDLATASENVDVAAAISVTGGGQTINSLRIGADVTGGAGDVLTINSGAILSSAAAAATVSTISAPIAFAPGIEGVITTPSALTISGPISGNNGLTKAGAGTLAMTGANTYTGQTTLLGGLVNMSGNVSAGNAGAFGMDASDIVMVTNSSANGNAATNRIWSTGGVATTFDRGFVIQGGGSSLVALGTDGSVGSSIVINGNVQINNPNSSNSNAFLTLEAGLTQAEGMTINGIISGTGGLRDTTAFGATYNTINGNNTFSGGTNMGGGTFSLGHDNALGTGTIWSSTAASTLRSAGGARTVANNLHFQVDTVFGGADDMTFNGNLYLAGTSRLLTVNTTSPNGITLNGNVNGGGVLKAGNGILALTNSANAYTGSTIVRNGTLVMSGNAFYGSGVLGTNPNTNLTSAGTIAIGDATTATTNNLALLANAPVTVARAIQVNAQNATGLTTIGGINTSGTAVYSGQLNLSRASTNLTAATGGTVRYDGAITQSIAASVNFIGSGIQAVTAANSYAGGTNVVGGTLLVNNLTGSGTGSGNVVVNVGTVLGGNGFIVPGSGNTVTINGSVAPGNSSGTLTIGSSATPTSVILTGAYNFELAAAGTGNVAFNSGLSSPSGTHSAHDVLNVFGSLNLTGSVLNLAGFGGTGLMQSQDYSWLIGTTNGGGLTGLPTIGNIAGGDFANITPNRFSVGNVGGNLYLNLAAVPEPGTAGLLVVGMVGFFSRRRRS